MSIITHTGSDYQDGIDCPGALLWRFMIAGPYQGRGFGKRALEKLIQHLKSMGIPMLYVSCGRGEGSSAGFCRKLRRLGRLTRMRNSAKSASLN